MKDGSVVKQDIIVDDVYDTFSDKIKRLGSTLSPGDEMRLHYTPEELEKYKELSITDYTNINVEDINAQSVFADHIRTNFKKQLLIDHIRAIDPESLKNIAKRTVLILKNPSQRYIIVPTSLMKYTIYILKYTVKLIKNLRNRLILMME